MTDIRKKAAESVENITNQITIGNAANDTLFGGEMAVIYYLYYLYEATGNDEYAEDALNRIEKVLLGFNDGKAILSGPYYCSGAGGLFYLLILLVRKGLVGSDMHAELKELGEDLLTYAVTGVENDYNDFVHGSFGLLHCFSQYAACFGDDGFVQQFLRAVEKKYLLMPNPWIVSSIGHADEKKMVNLGLSHGQAGFMIVLMRAYAITGISENIKERLLRNARYLLGCKREALHEPDCNFFPSFADPSAHTFTANNRLAWCYGDLGQVLFLYKAADFFNEASFRTAADSVCKASTARTDFNTTLLEAGQLCHGTGGVSHFYSILARLSGLACCTQAASFWMEQTINNIDKDLDTGMNSSTRFNMIEGLPGIGLALMSYLTEKKLDWGNIILLE